MNRTCRIFLACAMCLGMVVERAPAQSTPTLRILEGVPSASVSAEVAAAPASPTSQQISASEAAPAAPLGFGIASFTRPAFASVAVGLPVLASGATDPYFIPTRPADTTITSNSLEMASGATILVGNVRAVDGDRILTCGRAFLWREPDRLLATITPRMYQKESVPTKMLTRETTIDALNMHWNKLTDRLSASPSVTVKIEERSWDLATYTWVTISADSLEGFPGQKLLNFQGNVRIKDKDHAGQGRRLDYDKASGSVTLRGEARVEKDEWSPKEKRMIKRVLEGETINYDLNTKLTTSE